MSTMKPQNFHATKIFALKLSNCNMTRGYLKLTESSNFLQGNPINWPGTGQNWQEELRKFLALSYANREDTQRGMLDECKFLGEVEL